MNRYFITGPRRQLYTNISCYYCVSWMDGGPVNERFSLWGWRKKKKKKKKAFLTGQLCFQKNLQLKFFLNFTFEYLFSINLKHLLSNTKTDKTDVDGKKKKKKGRGGLIPLSFMGGG